MAWLKAFLAAFGLFVITVVVSRLVGINLAWVMILLTAAWAAVDSQNLQLKLYKTGISYSPVVLFLAIALLWIIGFPWYLVVRDQIKAGTLPLKNPAPSPPPGTAGLPTQ